VSGWKHAQVNDSQKLAQLLSFLMKKTQPVDFSSKRGLVSFGWFWPPEGGG
jgi:hypothetical protein